MITECKITEVLGLANDFYKYFLAELKNRGSVMGKTIVTNPYGCKMSKS